MSESIETLDGKRGLSRTEHALRSVLNGSIDVVRPRLIQGLEDMGYTVMTDAPLYARRRARGYARYYLSANILEYPTELTIGLREIGPDATLVTFAYVLEHRGGLSFKGDQHTLTREAEAIIALATWDKDASSCSSCGTAQISEARFCRVCGAPTVTREPAELEILRITAESRAGHHLITSGAVIAALAALAALLIVLIAGSAGAIPAGAMLGVVAAGLVLIFWGIFNLSQALNSVEARQPGYTSSTFARVTNAEPNALPSAPPLVTEATTSLLSKSANTRKKEPLFVKGRDTSPMDQ